MTFINSLIKFIRSLLWIWLNSNIICHSTDLLKKTKIDWIENETNERIISNYLLKNLLKKITFLFLIIEINCFSWVCSFDSRTSLSFSRKIKFSISDVIENCFSTLRKNLFDVIDLNVKNLLWFANSNYDENTKVIVKLFRRKILKIWYVLQTLYVTKCCNRKLLETIYRIVKFCCDLQMLNITKKQIDKWCYQLSKKIMLLNNCD